MRVRATTLLALLVIVASGITQGAVATTLSAAPESGMRVRGEVLVRFRPGTSPARSASIDRAVGGKLKYRLLLPRTELVHAQGGQTVEQLIARYQRYPEVLYAEPNSLAEAASLPNDTFFPDQWALRNVGQRVNGVTGTAGDDIHVIPAWDTTIGARGVTVGVADTGIDIGDPDLASNIWTNPGESGVLANNGVDDDGDGRIDDTNGWNFVNRTGDVSDDVWHGTFVAGIIGAVGNDGYGVSGVDWQVGLASLKACSLVAVSKNIPPALCTAARQADAFTYAGMMHMPVVNASFNGASYSSTVFNAIAAAPDTLFVTVPGNAGRDVDVSPQYPCGYALANVICVAATDQNDGLAKFSSYGATTVDLAAPGVNIYSTYPFVTRFREKFSLDISSRWRLGGANSRWATVCSSTTACVLADSPGGNYSGNQDTWIQTTQPVDLTNWRSCQIKYTLNGTVLSGDRLVVSASTDAATWSTVATWSGQVSNWPQATYDMPGVAGAAAAYLRFELVTDSTGNADGVSIDNVAVVCRPTPGSYAGARAEYAFRNGTSFAAAYVSGAAALLKAGYPSATVQQIRDALLSGVDPVGSLSGKVVTGGRLDVATSLAVLGSG